MADRGVGSIARRLIMTRYFNILRGKRLPSGSTAGGYLDPWMKVTLAALAIALAGVWVTSLFVAHVI
jgi:hypothetical protein